MPKHTTEEKLKNIKAAQARSKKAHAESRARKAAKMSSAKTASKAPSPKRKEKRPDASSATAQVARNNQNALDKADRGTPAESKKRRLTQDERVDAFRPKGFHRQKKVSPRFFGTKKQ